MSETITITVDGKDVRVTEGLNIIDAAEKAGVHIPNLCHLKGMKGIGACRLCLVEVEGLKAPVIACNTKVREGMIITTKTEKIQEVRRFVIDLILSMHPLDCMTCTKAGICDLQRYAYDFGLKESSFSRKKFGYPTDESNPFIKRDPDYCILCGRCVRVCKEQGTQVLDFMGRGIESKVVTAGDRPLQDSGCTFCGSCVDVCPVNAILESDRQRRAREWEYQKIRSVCMLCGNSCAIVASTKDGRIEKINADAEAGSAERYICAYGRFGFDALGADNRVAAPLKRMNGELKETTWEDALQTVANHLMNTGRETGIVSSSGITNEDALTLRKLARDVLNTKNVDTALSLYADEDFFILSQKADIDGADLIVLVDLSPSQWGRTLPALDVAIRRRISRGAKLIVIGDEESKIGEVAAVRLHGDAVAIVNRIVKSLMEKGVKGDRKLRSAVATTDVTEETEKAATLIAEAGDPVIFSSTSLFAAASNLAVLKGKIVAVPLESNAKGVSLMGLISDGMSFREMAEGKTRVLYAIGDVPIPRRPSTDFLIVQNAYITPLAHEADVVLPSAAFLETGGTVVDYLGRLKHLHKVVEPYAKSISHRDIFTSLAQVMGRVLLKPSESEIRKALRRKMKIRVNPFSKDERYNISKDAFIQSMNEPVIQGSRLLWLKEQEDAITA
jgi:NADH dehydrogenase/NADH:ubiquinone oxidoreductase subunit G